MYEEKRTTGIQETGDNVLQETLAAEWAAQLETWGTTAGTLGTDGDAPTCKVSAEWNWKGCSPGHRDPGGGSAFQTLLREKQEKFVQLLKAQRLCWELP